MHCQEMVFLRLLKSRKDSESILIKYQVLRAYIYKDIVNLPG
jgi:hypothetical protein